MKTSTSMRMMLRAPLKSLLTFILVAAVSFGLFSQICEYAVVSREIARLADFYKVTGTVESSGPPEDEIGGKRALLSQILDKTKYMKYFDTATPEGRAALEESMRQYGALSLDAMEGIAKSPRVAQTSTRLMGAGVSDTYYRMDGNAYFFDYSARLVAEGTVGSTSIITLDEKRWSSLIITFSEPSLLAGKPGWVTRDDGKKLTVQLPLVHEAGYTAVVHDSPTRSGPTVNGNYTLDFADQIKPGDRLIFLGRAVFGTGNTPTIIIGDTTDYWCDELRIITNEPDGYLEKEAFEAFRLAIEMTNADLHTFDIVYTDDMMAIPRFADRTISINQGRALTETDSATSNCVVSNRFLLENGLSVGSTITLGLGDMLFEQNAALGAVASVPERYKRPVDTAELTIVGTYVMLDTPKEEARDVHHTYSLNTIFVPKTLLPASADTQNHAVKPGEFSFVLDHPNSAEAFQRQIQGFLDEHGLTLLLGKNASTWRELSDAYNRSSAVTLITICVFLAAELAVGMLAVHLYIGRRKREYAIMRVLGVSGRDAGRALFIPLGALCLAAIAAGTGASWYYTTGAIGEIAAQYSAIAGYTYDTGMPALAVAISLLISSASFAVPALIILRRLGAASPLTLLADKQRGKARAGERTQAQAPLPLVEESAGTMPLERNGRFIAALRHVMRYVMRHSRRTVIKSLLSVLVPALLLSLIGQTAVMRERYAQLQRTLPITGYFLERAPVKQVLDMAAMPYVGENYYSGQLLVQAAEAEVLMAVANDLERYTENAQILYAQGDDTASLHSSAPVCILDEALLESLGLSLGGELRLVPSAEYRALAEKHLGTLLDMYVSGWQGNVTGSLAALGKKMEKLEAEGQYAAVEELSDAMEQFHAAVDGARTPFTIVGKIPFAADAARLPYQILAPAGEWYRAFAAEGVLFDEAEFTLSDNDMADTFKSDGNRMMSAGRKYSPNLQFFVDLSALESVRRISDLLEKLFPVIVAASIVIGALFQALMVFQLAKDAGIARLLGTTVARTCAMLCAERILLTLLGLMLSAGALVLFNGAALNTIAASTVIHGAVFLAANVVASVVSATVVSKRGPLKLLQMKDEG